MSSPSSSVLHCKEYIFNAKWSIVIKFHVKHYHVGRNAVKAFGMIWIGTLVTMAR